MEVKVPYLGVHEAVGFHVSNLLVNGLERARVGISSSFALQDKLVGVCMVGSAAGPEVIQRQNTRI